jgi:hypothetical protein
MAFTAKIPPLCNGEASSFAGTALNVIRGAIRVVVIYVGASNTAKAALFLFRFQPLAMLLRLLQALRCSSRIPSSVAVILRDGIIAAARRRIDNIGLIAAGAIRAFGGHGAGSSAGDATLFAREMFNDRQWIQNRGNLL